MGAEKYVHLANIDLKYIWWMTKLNSILLHLLKKCWLSFHISENQFQLELELINYRSVPVCTYVQTEGLKWRKKLE